MCGEKFGPVLGGILNGGSPPRVRGKVEREGKPLSSHRITPACAGKSCWFGKFQFGFEDHPRVCGEKSSPLGTKFCVKGSPPRVRGKAFGQAWDAIVPRITPACAGKSWTDGSKIIPLRDHPRVCGEKTKKSP